MNLRLLIGLLIMLPSFVLAQFNDDFSDGDFTSNPTWSGDDAEFEIDLLNRLHLVAPLVTSTSYLSTASESIVDASWEFTVELDFNPTSSNMAQVFLVSSNADLETDLQGYFVRIGNTTKEVSLYRQDGIGDVNEIIDGTDNDVDMDAVNVRVKVTRSETGNWELSTDNSGGDSYVVIGSINDETYTSSLFFGVHCKYTSTRSDKFYFSNFLVSGSGFIDTESPTVLSYEVLSANQIELVYSEPMDEVSTSNLVNYSVSDGIGIPSSIANITSDEVILTFTYDFIDGQNYIMDINGVADLSGNLLNTTFDFVYFDISEATTGDVVINEIMADPTPVVGLPDVEFIELYNQSESAFDLNGWSLINTTSENSLTGILASGAYLILCDEDDVTQLSAYGPTLGITSFSALANAGDSLTLVSGIGNIIDVVSYTDSWYQNSIFSEGGYTLERINPYLVCSGINNWSSSLAAIGGTPGDQNSIYDETPDMVAPELMEVFVNSSNQLTLLFDEILLSDDVMNAEFEIDNGISVVGSQLITNNQVILQLEPPLTSSVIYTLQVNDLQDCAGNILIENNQAEFGLSEAIMPGDIVINEILNNPRPDGFDFIEIYNNSNKFLSLKNSKLAGLEDEIFVDFETVTTNDKILFPGEYLVLTEDKLNILNEYPNAIEENILEMDNVPSLNDDEGIVVLLNHINEAIDIVYYYDDYHFELLDDDEGVSLERLNFNDPSSDANNWHSAAETEGFATPGYLNSQHFIFNEQSTNYNIQPRVISPDNDGFEDVMAIHYSLDQPGYLANVSILDDHGRLIKKISQNTLLGVEGTMYWDGIMDEGAKAPIGIYIVFIEFFNLEGKIEISKEVVTVAARL